MQAVEDTPPPFNISDTIESTTAAATLYARNVFQAIFHDDIASRLLIAPEAYRNAKIPPRPLDLLSAEAGKFEFSNVGGGGGGVSGSGSGGAGAGAGAGSTSVGVAAQRVPSVTESTSSFLTSLSNFYTSSSPTLRSTIGSIDFSKDDAEHLALVTAATNLRAAIFSIPLQSSWDIKSIAGNIIPAIATTNAIAAGLQVLEVFKVLEASDSAKARARITYISRAPTGSRKRALLTALPLPLPRAGCYVCGTQSVTLKIDTTAAPLRLLVNDVLKGVLSFVEPNIDNGVEFNFIDSREEGEDDDDFAQKIGFLSVPLAQLVGGGIKDGTVLTVTDFAQALTLTINVIHTQSDLLGERGFQLVGVVDVAAAAATVKARNDADAAAAAAATTTQSVTAAGTKRGREEGESNNNDIIELLDDDTIVAPAAKRIALEGGGGGGGGGGQSAGGADDEVIEIN